MKKRQYVCGHLYGANGIQRDKTGLKEIANFIYYVIYYGVENNVRTDIQKAFSIERWDELGQFLWAAAIGEDIVATKS